MIDKEDRDVIEMCNWNHRRSSLTTTVGYIVPQKEAQEMAVERAVRSKADGAGVLFLFAVKLFVLVAVTVVALA